MNKILHKVWVLLAAFAVSMPMWALEEVDGVYQISSAADLKAFAELVNGGQNTVSAVLTADIVADADQPMIGLTSGTAFKGSFDGQGHTTGRATMPSRPTLQVSSPTSLATSATCVSTEPSRQKVPVRVRWQAE